MTRRSAIIVGICLAALCGFSFWQSLTRVPGDPYSFGRATLNSPNTLEAAQRVPQEGMIDVRRYGASGDGVTDDTEAIRAALAAAESVGGSVFIPRGTYLITSQLTITARITLRGDGESSILLFDVAGASEYIRADLVDGIVVENLYFKIIGDFPGYLQEDIFLSLNKCSDCRVEGCTFYSLNDAGEPTMFSHCAVSSGNRSIVTRCHSIGSHGNFGGSADPTGTGVWGQNHIFSHNIIEKYSDTGIGLWTNAGNTIITENLFLGWTASNHVQDVDHPLAGVAIDVAGGGNDLIISNNIIIGGLIGIRHLTNLGYDNLRTLIQGNIIKEQYVPDGVDGNLHTPRAIHISHDSAADYRISILGNTIIGGTGGAGGYSATLNFHKYNTGNPFIKMANNTFYIDGSLGSDVKLLVTNLTSINFDPQKWTNDIILVNGAVVGSDAWTDCVNSARVVATTFVQAGVSAGVTATNPGVQGDNPITTQITEVSVVANTNDAVTAPAAVAGREFTVINNGMQTLEIWPASGDNLGSGVDTAVTLAAGSNVTYVAYDATNWEVK